MVHFTFQGAMASVFTPFKENYFVHFEEISKYAQHLYTEDIKGVLVNGPCGEGMSMSLQDRKKVVESWLPSAHRLGMHIMVHVGGACLPDVKTMARHSLNKGADSIVTLPELFNKPSSVENLVSYLKIISEEASTIPLLYYHDPILTGVNLDMAALVSEASKQIANFEGIIYSSTDLETASEILRVSGSSKTVFLNGDQVLAAGLAMGFKCYLGTTYSMLFSYSRIIIETMTGQKNYLNKATEQQNELNKLIKIITQYGDWVPAMKVAMQHLSGLSMGPPRPPLQRLGSSTHIEMGEKLKLTDTPKKKVKKERRRSAT